VNFREAPDGSKTLRALSPSTATELPEAEIFELSSTLIVFFHLLETRARTVGIAAAASASGTSSEAAGVTIASSGSPERIPEKATASPAELIGIPLFPLIARLFPASSLIGTPPPEGVKIKAPSRHARANVSGPTRTLNTVPAGTTEPYLVETMKLATESACSIYKVPSSSRYLKPASPDSIRRER